MHVHAFPVHVSLYVNVSTHFGTCVYMHVCMCIHMYVDGWASTMRLRILTSFVCVCVCVCVCVLMCMCHSVCVFDVTMTKNLQRQTRLERLHPFSLNDVIM